MALTIKMRIDEQPEHSYVFSTGDNGEIELIPLSVVQNGSYTAPDGKAYNVVTVNVPTPQISSLNITENGTYEAEDGTVWNVVNVNVEPLLEVVTRSYTENGTYTVTPTEGYDGISDVTVDVDVPNTYTQADNGKVVSNGSLVSQTAHADVTPTTSDQTINTTLNNSIKVKGDADLVAGNIKKDVEIFGVTGTYEGGGGSSNCDVAYVTEPGSSGATQLIAIRQGEQPQAIYVFSVLPDGLIFTGADVIVNFACCINSVYDGVNYTYDSVVESSNYGQITLDNNAMLVLDGWVPSTTPAAGYDVFGIDSGFLYGWFIDVTDPAGFGLQGDYVVVVVYGVEPPVE